MLEFKEDHNLTQNEKLRVSDLLEELKLKLNFSNDKFKIAKINTDGLDQFLIKGINIKGDATEKMRAENNLTLSLPGFFSDEYRKMGVSHLKTERVYSSSKNPENKRDLKNTIELKELNILLKGLANFLKRNGVQKINIIVNAYYSFDKHANYYMFNIKELGTSIFEDELKVLDKDNSFQIDQYQLESYIKNEKACVKEFLYDFNFMNLGIFNKSDVTKNFKKTMEHLLMIGY